MVCSRINGSKCAARTRPPKTSARVASAANRAIPSSHFFFVLVVTVVAAVYDRLFYDSAFYKINRRSQTAATMKTLAGDLPNRLGLRFGRLWRGLKLKTGTR